ncbi:MAG: YCF48-related protein [Candidatus Kapaibacterium sp.]
MKSFILISVVILGCFVSTTHSTAQLNIEEQNIPDIGLHINAIAMTSESHGVTVGDFGKILLSDDGFTTWTIVPTGTKKELMSVAFYDSQIGLTVGADGVIYRTTDAGKSWQQQSSGVRDTLKSIAILGDRAIVVGSGGTIIESADRGVTWTRKQSGHTLRLNAIKFRGSSIGVIVGAEGLILRTDDAGKTWNTVFRDTSDLGSYSYIASVDWPNDSTAIAVGYYDFTARSTDWGRTWKKYYTALPPIAGGHCMRIFFLNSSVGFIGGSLLTASYPQSSVVWTSDGGNTWQIQDSIPNLAATIPIYHNLPVFSDFFAVNQNRILAVGSDFNVDKTPIICSSGDGGTTWRYNLYYHNGQKLTYDTMYKRYYSPAAGYDDVDFVDDKLGFVSGIDGTILKTSDGGDTWQKTPTNTTRRIRKIVAFSPTLIAAAGDTALVMVSTNGGESWNSYYPWADSSFVLGIGFQTLTVSNNHTLWVSGYNNRLPLAETACLLKSIDTGRTWERIYISGADNDRYYYMVFPTPLQGWIFGYRNFASQTRSIIMLHTEDGGISWQEQTLPPFKKGEYISPFTAITFTDTLHGFAPISGAYTDTNTYQTYLYTTDGGQTWMRKDPYYNTLPSYYMRKGSLTDLRFADERHGVIIATWSAIGVPRLFFTSNAGEMWTVADYLADNRDFSREFDRLSYPTPKRCWVLGHPFRIFRLTLPEVTSVEEPAQHLSNGIILSPNPVSSSFTVSDAGGATMIKVINSIGVEIKNVAISGDKVTIDVSDLASGIYFVQMRTATGMFTKPIVVSR